MIVQTAAQVAPDPSEDSVRACARELGTLFRRVKHLAGVCPGGGPVLDRPAYGLLVLAADRGAVRLTALAEAIPADLSTVSRQVAAPEATGWLARERDPGDGRASLVRVTAAGHEALTRTIEARRAQLGDLLTDWTDADRREFARLLGHFNATIEERLGATAPGA